MSKWICNGTEFNVGDRVKVVREVESLDENGMGEGKQWHNTWNESLTAHIGETDIIECIDDAAGVYLENCQYSFPLSALEKVVSTLPVGELTLVDASNIVYTAVHDSTWDWLGTVYTIYWEFPVDGAGMKRSVGKNEILAAIDSGFWEICKSPAQVEREEKMLKMKEQQAVLINEIAALEKEIANG